MFSKRRPITLSFLPSDRVAYKRIAWTRGCIIRMMKSRSIAVILLLSVWGLAYGRMRNQGWWKSGVFYQVYPRSFMDSNGDGVGDLQGIREKIGHFTDLGITGIWLSPINRSPMVDFGYDISDFRDVDPLFGTLADLEVLIRDAHLRGLKVIMDLVPNHTSDRHEWFGLSANRTGNYTDYYIWADAKGNATECSGDSSSPSSSPPPNNWVSVFNGTAWTCHAGRKQMYFHQFYKEQPDLNYANENVQREMKDIMKYWLDKGIDGFRIDAVPHLFEGNITLDEPPLNVTGPTSNDHAYYDHVYTKDQPRTYELVASWRKFVDDYAVENNREEILLMTEAYTSWSNTIKYYDYGSHVPFNFKFITDVTATSGANQFKKLIDDWTRMMPNGSVANWVMGNHDRVRIATRYPGRADQMTMLAMILPGVAVTYYGEEIGMEDNTTLRKFDFRDGCRTPFQWDDTANGGFSRNSSTWLPVHASYRTVNLAKQKRDDNSHYKLYTELVKLRASSTLTHGSLETLIPQANVLAVARKGGAETITLLINFSDNENVTVNLAGLLTSSNTTIHLSSVGSGLAANTKVQVSAVTVPAKASVILRSYNAESDSAPNSAPRAPSILSLVVLAALATFRYH